MTATLYALADRVLVEGSWLDVASYPEWAFWCLTIGYIWIVFRIIVGAVSWLLQSDDPPSHWLEEAPDYEARTVVDPAKLLRFTREDE